MRKKIVLYIHIHNISKKKSINIKYVKNNVNIFVLVV